MDGDCDTGPARSSPLLTSKVFLLGRLASLLSVENSMQHFLKVTQFKLSDVSSLASIVFSKLTPRESISLLAYSDTAQA